MIWLDAQLSPALAPWITASLGHPAQAVRELGLLQATDHAIFAAARQAQAILLTKDSDFVHLLDRLGPPPQVIWLTCGNTANDVLQLILRRALPQALQLIQQGEPLVEITS